MNCGEKEEKRDVVCLDSSHCHLEIPLLGLCGDYHYLVLSLFLINVGVNVARGNLCIHSTVPNILLRATV